MFVIQFIQA